MKKMEEKRKKEKMRGFRGKYSNGVSEYYENCNNYSNPHSSKFNNIINRLIQWIPSDLHSRIIPSSSSYSSLSSTSSTSCDILITNHFPSLPILDLACGKGEITKTLLEYNINNIIGLDPFLSKQYHFETGKEVYNNSFEDIINRKVILPKCSLIICSYGLHLCQGENLNQLLDVLKEVSDYLCVITPHGLPIIEETTGWYKLFTFKYANIKTNLYTTNIPQIESNNKEEKQEVEEVINQHDQFEIFSNLFESLNSS